MITLLQAREAGLAVRAGLLGGNQLAESPRAQRHTGALVVRAAMQIRAEERSDIEVGWERAMAMSRAAPPVPETFVDERSVYLERLHLAAPRACPFDAPGRAGMTACAVCSGAGYIERLVQRSRYHSEMVKIPCTACMARGLVSCASCDGTGRSAPATIVRVTDVSVTVDDVFLPRVPGDLAERLTTLLMNVDDYPDAMARDLETWRPTDELEPLSAVLAEPCQRAMGTLRAKGAQHAVIRALECFLVPLLELDYGKKTVLVVRAGERWEAWVTKSA